MKLLVAAHDSSMHHDTGRGHPERADRVPAVLAGIESSGLPVQYLSPEPASVELLATVHDPRYIADLERFCANGGGSLDPDTVASGGSWDAARRAAGAGPAICESLASGAADLGYVAMRPPGHHAVRSKAMGFCLFNNVAVTAAHLAAMGNRVAIVDWDVHHGNGTQDLFYANGAVLYMSIHQADIYPGTGSVDEVGADAGQGTNLNLPVPGQTGGKLFRRAMSDLWVPILAEFAPDWLLVSSGYDAHSDDPLAGLRLVAGDYGAMARALASLMPPGRSVIFLEGGYDLAALEASTCATVRGWLDGGYEVDPTTEGTDAERHLRAANQVAARYWRLS